MRTMREPNAQAMLVEIEEAEALQTADQILHEVQLAFGGDNTIMSLETGEVISPGELARARAILSFVATYRVVEVNPK